MIKAKEMECNRYYDNTWKFTYIIDGLEAEFDECCNDNRRDFLCLQENICENANNCDLACKYSSFIPACSTNNEIYQCGSEFYKILKCAFSQDDCAPIKNFCDEDPNNDFCNMKKDICNNNYRCPENFDDAIKCCEAHPDSLRCQYISSICEETERIIIFKYNLWINPNFLDQYPSICENMKDLESPSWISDGLPEWGIALIVIGIVIVLAAIIIVLILWKKGRIFSHKQDETTAHGNLFEDPGNQAGD